MYQQQTELFGRGAGYGKFQGQSEETKVKPSFHNTIGDAGHIIQTGEKRPGYWGDLNNAWRLRQPHETIQTKKSKKPNTGF